jgi:hypothetical protein
VQVGYEEFRDALLARHENPMTSTLSTVGDALELASLPVGIATRSARVGLTLFAAGYAVAVVAHLFQPGTLHDEIAGIVRHPVWALRAETDRVGRQLRRS